MQSQETQTEEHAAKQETSSLEKCQGRERKGKTEGLSQSGEDYLNTM